MTTYALGIQERIDELRGAIARIEALRERYLKLESSNGSGRSQVEEARALWRAHLIEFGSRWQLVKSVLDHYEQIAEPTPAAAAIGTPAAEQHRSAAPRNKTVLTLPPPPETRRARYLAAKGLKP